MSASTGIPAKCSHHPGQSSWGPVVLSSYPHDPRLSGAKARGSGPVDEGLGLAELSMQMKHTSPRRHLQLPIEAEEYLGTLDKLRLFPSCSLLAWGNAFPSINLLIFNKALEVNRVNNIQADPYEQKESSQNCWAEKRQSETRPWAG